MAADFKVILQAGALLAQHGGFVLCVGKGGVVVGDGLALLFEDGDDGAGDTLVGVTGEACVWLVVDQPAHEAVLLLFVAVLHDCSSFEHHYAESLIVALLPDCRQFLAQVGDIGGISSRQSAPTVAVIC